MPIERVDRPGESQEATGMKKKALARRGWFRKAFWKLLPRSNTCLPNNVWKEIQNYVDQGWRATVCHGAVRALRKFD